MSQTNSDSGAHGGAEEMSGIYSAYERDAFERILQVLDERGLSKVQKVIVLTGAIRRVTGIE